MRALLRLSVKHPQQTVTEPKTKRTNEATTLYDDIISTPVIVKTKDYIYSQPEGPRPMSTRARTVTAVNVVVNDLPEKEKG